MEKVALRMAFEWTCPECGEDHFGRCIAWEGSPEEKEELNEYLGIVGVRNEKGGWVRMPEYVTCPRCNQTFPTEEIE